MSSEIEDTRKIGAILMIEVLGKPPEYVTEAIEGIIEKINQEQGVEIKDKKINEPKEIEKQPGFYTSFAEIEVEVEEVLQLVTLVFKYMPSHIEIIKPERIDISNNSLADILTGITQKLHGYDEMARILQIEKSVLEKKLRETLEPPVNKEEKNK